MQVIGRRARTKRRTKTITVAGAVTATLLATVASALPASAKATSPSQPTYDVHLVLSGQSLGHWYTKAGSSKRYWERLSSPDDITIFDGDLFTTFQNGVGPQGQASPDGNRYSTIVEFTQSGHEVHQWDLRGKCDGLTANPATGQVMATIDEDANSSLDSIDSWTGRVTDYRYSKNPLPHNGGTDAISFYRGLMLISASAPGTAGAAAPNPAYPAVYSVNLDPYNKVAYVHALFYDEAKATAANGPHAGKTVTLGLTDPDSNEDVPYSAVRFAGDFMLTSQGDKEQIYVHVTPSGHGRLWVLHLSQSVDDTAWSTSWKGAFYAASTSDDTVDEIVDSMFLHPEGTRVYALFPIVRAEIVSLRGAPLHPQGMTFVAF